MNKTYQEKLRDPRWQRKRLEKMDDENWSCELCGDGTTELHVHHLFYDQEREPWQYALDQLRCICSDCHTLSHLPEQKVVSFASQLTPPEPKLPRIPAMIEHIKRALALMDNTDKTLIMSGQQLMLDIIEKGRLEKETKTALVK